MLVDGKEMTGDETLAYMAKAKPFRVPDDVPPNAPFEEKTRRAAQHDPPKGAKFSVSPAKMRVCADAAELAGDMATATFLRELATNQERLETVAKKRRYQIKYVPAPRSRRVKAPPRRRAARPAGSAPRHGRRA